MKFSFALLLCAFALCSCAGIGGQSFNESDFGTALSSGTGVVRGHDFLTHGDGTFRDASTGTKVRLIPMTPYTTVLVANTMEGRPFLADPRVNKYIRTTVTDGTGNFEFTGLPAGTYYVMSKVSFETASLTNEGGETDVNSGQNYAQVTVRPGQTVTVSAWTNAQEKTEQDRW